MLDLSQLVYLYSEREQNGYVCVGECDGEKIYRIQYVSKSYYTTQTYTHLYVVYDHNPDDYDVEVLDIQTSQVLKHFNRLFK